MVVVVVVEVVVVVVVVVEGWRTVPGEAETEASPAGAGGPEGPVRQLQTRSRTTKWHQHNDSDGATHRQARLSESEHS